MSRDKRGCFSGIELVPAASGTNALRRTYAEPLMIVMAIVGAVLAVRGPGDTTRLLPSIRAITAENLPGGFTSGIATLEQYVEMSRVRERMLALLATFFAALALILACIGLYGVMAYHVARRTREIGIRIAVGARQQSVIWMMVREMLLVVGPSEWRWALRPRLPRTATSRASCSA